MSAHIVTFAQDMVYVGLIDTRGTGILTATCPCGWEAATRTNPSQLEHCANVHDQLPARYPQETQ